VESEVKVGAFVREAQRVARVKEDAAFADLKTAADRFEVPDGVG
jgi:hypothetical protein